MRTGGTYDRAYQLKGLFAALLALVLISAVSPVYVMPGCTMNAAPFDFSCEHGVITEHITELTTAQATPVFLAVLVVGFALTLTRRRPLVLHTAPADDDHAVDDPLGERMRV